MQGSLIAARQRIAAKQIMDQRSDLMALTCGVDEAGRGPWAGPVCAAAVILNPADPIAGLADSKRLSAAARERLEPQIKARALAYSVVFVSAADIDRVNIRRATHQAMQRAVAELSLAPGFVQIDGNDAPVMPCPAEAIIKGDGKIACISAASILAKTARDRLMITLDQDWPGYGFAQHKGYGVAAHAEALARLGPCPEHRMSFRPVALARR
jgi:ribonuclease HII